MAVLPKTILTGLRKPEAAAVAVETESVVAGSGFTPEASSRAGSLPTDDAAQSLALERWVAQRNAELYQTGPDGTYAYRNQADGTFEPDGARDIGVSARREARRSSCDHSKLRSFCIVQSNLSVSARSADQSPITAGEYRTLQEAYDHFNAALFESSLPQVLITLQRHRGARGYFSPKRFQRREKSRERIHEVALNPDCFINRTDEEILSTLAHEMVHVWQQEHGHPGRGRYHNREWAARMRTIGLMPSTTGKPGGGITGDCVSHYILEGRPFVAACLDFLGRYRLVWESATALNADSGSPLGTVRTQTRTKFTCPNCGLNVWAKPDALIDCHRCSREARETVLLLAVD